jgi:anti-sigma regulatory factor (Ser/Thr protein kinase)
MEMTAGRTQWFRVSDPSQIGQVRRAAIAFASELGFGEVERGRVGIVATEAAANLIKHGGGGSMLLQALTGSAEVGLEVIAVDSGAGMVDVPHCTRDGFSTAGSPGTGLGSIHRLSSKVEIYSHPGRGTVVLARISPGNKTPPTDYPFEVGALCVNHPGEEECGDTWAVRQVQERLLVMVVDGLGHGGGAARAAQVALSVFQEARSSQPVEILEAIHLALRPTRGAAVGIARIDPAAGEVTFGGVGNVAAMITGEGEEKRLLSHNGTLGHQVRKIQEVACPWHPASLLIMQSDGIAGRWSLRDYPGLSQNEASVIAAALFRDHRRENDDATITVVRERPAQ